MTANSEEFTDDLINLPPAMNLDCDGDNVEQNKYRDKRVTTNRGQ